MNKEITYETNLLWTGNLGQGTLNYTSYERSYTVQVQDKPDLLGSADPMFRGDKHKWNPEELLLASLSSCHMLWYLHLCSTNKILVQSYQDSSHAKMIIEANGKGKFESVELKPLVTITNQEQKDLAESLHSQAHKFCFIANSVNFPISLSPSIKVNL